MIETKESLSFAKIFMRMFIFWNTLAAVFGLFAIVQLNDPDPWIWFWAYTLNTVFLIGAARQKIFIKTSLALCVICFVFVYLHWPPTFEGFTGDMDYNPHIELAREAAGLLLISISQAGIALYGARRDKQS